MIGGGDSAMEDSIFVSKFAKNADDRSPPRRVPRLEDHAGARPGQGEHRVPDAICPARSSSPATTARSPRSDCKHAETGEEKEIEVGGAFVAIGHRPRSELVKGQVELDDEGYVVVDEPSTKTKLAGVFAVGDLVDHTYRQAVTAAGSGTKGALDAEWYLRDMPPDPEEHWGKNTGEIVEAVESSLDALAAAPDLTYRPVCDRIPPGI